VAIDETAEAEETRGFIALASPYLVSKASAPDWEYRITPYIVTSTDLLPSFLLLCLSMFPLFYFNVSFSKLLIF